MKCAPDRTSVGPRELHSWRTSEACGSIRVNRHPRRPRGVRNEILYRGLYYFSGFGKNRYARRERSRRLRPPPGGQPAARRRSRHLRPARPTNSKNKSRTHGAGEMSDAGDTPQTQNESVPHAPTSCPIFQELVEPSKLQRRGQRRRSLSTRHAGTTHSTALLRLTAHRHCYYAASMSRKAQSCDATALAVKLPVNLPRAFFPHRSRTVHSPPHARPGTSTKLRVRS